MTNEERNQLFEENKGLVHHLISTKFSSCKNREDLLQEGMLALWNAALKFNDQKYKNFGPYATTSICRRLNKFFIKQSKNSFEILFSDVDLERQIEDLFLNYSKGEDYE